jgi:tyrosinase
VPPPVRIRRDVNNLAANDPIITFYEQAIREMQKKGLDDPLSWRYQAAIHDYPDPDTTLADRLRDPTDPNKLDRDPSASAADKLPANRTTYWRQCQHGSWFFLSWHRMYLHFFEKIIMNIVAQLPNGPKDWALPYWNYSSSAAAALLPAPFQNPTLPDTTPNHLFVAERTPNANAGQPFLLPTAVGLDCLKGKAFADSFGGPQVKNHPPGGLSGLVENVPHNRVHGALGGSQGFMSFFSTAPLDPMFWLHHCNIDRLWEEWVQRQKTLKNLNRNPKDTAWLDVPFDFHDATGAAVTMTSRQVMNTRLAPLSYEYEDTSDPFKGAP